MEMKTLLLVREALNGFLCCMGLCCAVCIAAFLLRIRLAYGTLSTKVPGVAMACVLFWVFLIDGAQNGLNWLFFEKLLHGTEDYRLNPIWNVSFISILFASAIVMINGIKLFSQDQVGSKGWVVSLLFSIAVLCLFGLQFLR